jgi:hypothetical protein
MSKTSTDATNVNRLLTMLAHHSARALVAQSMGVEQHTAAPAVLQPGLQDIEVLPACVLHGTNDKRDCIRQLLHLGLLLLGLLLPLCCQRLAGVLVCLPVRLLTAPTAVPAQMQQATASVTLQQGT